MIDHLCGLENLCSARGEESHHVFLWGGTHEAVTYCPTPTADSRSGHTGDCTNSLKLSFICKSASQAVLGRMQLTLDATRRTPHVFLRACCKQCLPGRWKTDVLRPGIAGVRGSVVIRLRPYMISSTHHPQPPLPRFWLLFFQFAPSFLSASFPPS